MSYTATYIDANGRAQTIEISENDSKEALRNHIRALEKKYDPKYVTVERVKADAGELAHLKIGVKNVRTHYLTSSSDSKPKETDSMTADVIVYMGYPFKSVDARYPENHYLASPNVFRSGRACIDTWEPGTSSLITVADKLLNDMIHNPAVTRYDSEANSYMDKWHKEGVAKGAFPTMNPKLLYAAAPLPRRRPHEVVSTPLPSRRR
ncbi:hypothetical protein [Ruminococcus sp. 5_1_39BFAA]|uniref:hypothetical protein n=1 Tax=Ruminococcus sp. 5_1_39BFAA TaxID=457412 RepID=UPI0035685ED5